MVLSASPREEGNSDLLCDAFLAGAAEAGHQAEKVRVQDLAVRPCLGCNTCKGNGGSCVQKDDMAGVIDKMLQADVIAMATPVYFGALNAQAKTLIDRTYARYTDMQDKELYFFITGATPNKDSLDAAAAGLHACARCLPGAKECGMVYGPGVAGKGDVKTGPAMEEARAMGRAV